MDAFLIVKGGDTQASLKFPGWVLYHIDKQTMFAVQVIYIGKILDQKTVLIELKKHGSPY